MTVASEINRSGPYNGNGVTVAFDYTFQIKSETDIQVIKTDAAAVETVLTLTADYTVTGVLASSGQVILATPLPTGEMVLCLRKVPFTQGTDLQNQGAYLAQTVEDALDLATMRDQQLQEQINRAVIIPASADPATLVGLIADVLRLASSVANVDTVAGIAANVTTVAGIAADVVAAPTHAANAATSETNAGLSAADAAASAASIVPANFLRKDDNLASLVNAAAAAANLGLEIGVNVEAFDAAAVKSNIANTFTKPQKMAAVVLATAIAADFAAAEFFTANVNGATFDIANPTGPIDGVLYAIEITFTTANTATFGTNFNITGYTPAATAGVRDALVFKYDSASGKFDLWSVRSGVSA